MSNIVISMFPEEGHLIPSFRLARMLRAEGHQVTYVGLPDFEAYVRQQGFDFVPILKQRFPIGTREQQVRNLATKKGIAFLKEVSHTKFFRELCRLAQAEQSEINTMLDRCKPDLFIIDSFLAPLTLRVRALGVPVVLLSININMPKADNYPPVVTNISPDETPASRSRTNMAWGISGMVRTLTSLLAGFDFQKTLVQVAAACGYPASEIVPAALYPKVRPSAELPELVLCPQAFDFPRLGAEDSGIHCIEPSIDIDRASGAFPWEALDDSKPIVFCTLGSQSHLYGKGRAFFQAVIDAVGAKPDWQLVLAVGPHIDPTSFQPAPANVLIVQWAPHTEILKRAALMINHGGLGTIKECIFFDVPMLVFPITRDQPGYAARVAYHGLGLMGSLQKVSKAQIAELIDRIECDPSFKEHVSRMGVIFRQMEAARAGLDIIEAQLGRTIPVLRAA